MTENPIQQSNSGATSNVDTLPPFVAYTHFAELEEKLEFYLLRKAPFQLPEAFREFIVKVGPWLYLIVFVITLPLFLGMLGLATLISPLLFLSSTSDGTSPPAMVASVLTSAVFLGLCGWAIPGLFKRKKSAWILSLYAGVAHLAMSLAALQVLATAVWGVIWGYVLFQIKYKYTQ